MSNDRLETERKRTRAQTLDDALRKADALNRTRELRIGPRQMEFDILPKSVRFNLFLLKQNKRRAFQVDGWTASYLKEDFAASKQDFLHFFIKHSQIADLVCVDYPYGLLFTSLTAIRDVLHVSDLSELRPKDILRHAGALLEIPCAVVSSEAKWLHNPHQIAIAVDEEDLKQFMCTREEFDRVFGVAIAEFKAFRAMADDFNREFTRDPIRRVSLELRAKTNVEIDAQRDFVAPTSPLGDDDVKVYAAWR